ncbi:MAG: RNA polymerase sigma factor [Eubacteriales bacterium]
METNVISDEQIISLYHQKDERAIYETDRKYRSYLLTVANPIVSDYSDREECLNDTYLGAWNAIPPAVPKSLKAFLTTIMRRIAVNRYHAGRAMKRCITEYTCSLNDFEDFLTDEGTESEQAAEDLGRLLNDFVRSLTKRRRYIFMARYYLSRPIEEIVRDLGCSTSTVNKEIAAIKNELRGKLEGEGYL